MILSGEELDAILAHGVRDYPHEACGVVLMRGDERRVVACRNIQDELHRREPERHSRDARTAYYIDPQDLLRIGRLEGQGFSIEVIYHSHVDAGAYFSETDRKQALVVGEPMYPGVTYVVASVVAGRPDAVAAFRWDAGRRDFVEVELPLGVEAISQARERNPDMEAGAGFPGDRGASGVSGAMSGPPMMTEEKS